MAHDRAGISHDETGNEKLVWAMLPLVLVGNVGTGLARMPQHLVMSFSKDLQNVDDIYQNYSDYFPTKQSYHRKLRGILGIAEDGGMEERLSYQMHPGTPGKEISLYVGNDDRGGAARKLLKFAYTLPLKLTSGLLLDSVGKPAWDNMVRRTQSIFRPSRGYVTSDSKIAESSEDEGHYAAARMFF